MKVKRRKMINKKVIDADAESVQAYLEDFTKMIIDNALKED